jgi:ribosomal peptide maturation radical SAM protein 1
MPSAHPPIALGHGAALIVVPPFAGVDRPSLAAHTLQACARERGFEVGVFYASLHLAACLGDACYEAICFAPTSSLLGERFFARTAYGTPSLGRDHPSVEAAIEEVSGQVQLSHDAIRALEDQVPGWVDEVASALAASAYRVIGFSTTFEQTASSIALINRLKQLDRSKIVIIGGANCEGEMAHGIDSLHSLVDYIFSGESESSFPEFLASIARGSPPSARIVEGHINRAMDAIPLPDFSEFFEQRTAALPGSSFAADDLTWLPYEASRGCWWGEKHHCTFCGINGQGMAFRQRSPERVVADLRALTTRHKLNRICMTDNIMPHSYFRTLIPTLGDDVPGLHLFYEQKANLTLDQVLALKKAGVALIQPGIEALSSDLLKRMDKGVSAKQNVALLRYALSTGVAMNWNLLYAFPGDTAADYVSTLALIRQLHHLQPPTDLCRLSVDRFSPYHFAPERYGIRSITPMPSYASILPESADIDKIAYHFLGDYDSGILADEPLFNELEAEVRNWKQSWRTKDVDAPMLAVVEITDDEYMVMDTRNLEGQPNVMFLDARQVAPALVAHSLEHDDAPSRDARSRLLAVEYEGCHLPLATAVPAVLARFEQLSRTPAQPPAPVVPYVQLSTPAAVG